MIDLKEIFGAIIIALTATTIAVIPTMLIDTIFSHSKKMENINNKVHIEPFEKEPINWEELKEKVNQE